MEDKITGKINNVRQKKKQRLTKERFFNLITKANTSIDQGGLLEAFESRKANGVFFNRPKRKRESCFLANKNNHSWIILNKSPTKINTVTLPKMKSPSTPDKSSILDNAIVFWKKQQPSNTSTP